MSASFTLFSYKQVTLLCKQDLKYYYRFYFNRKEHIQWRHVLGVGDCHMINVKDMSLKDTFQPCTKCE